MKYTEKVDVKACKWLLEMCESDHSFLANSLDKDDPRMNATTVIRALHSMMRNKGVNVVNYTKKDKFNLLRDYGSGIQSIPTNFRGLICRHMTDVDIKNCHPTIIHQLCKKHEIPCHYLEEYVLHRDDILSSKKATKMEIIVSMNYKKSLKLDTTRSWLKSFDNEMKQIQKALILIEDYKPCLELAQANNKTNVEGAFMSNLATSFEVKILHTILECPKVEVAVLMYDGFMFYGDAPQGNAPDYSGNLPCGVPLHALGSGTKSLIRGFGNEVPDYLFYLSQLVKDKLGFDVIWTYKAHDLSLSVPDDYVFSVSYDCQNDKEASTIILDLLKDDMIFCNNRIYCKRGNIWICDTEKVRNFIITFIMDTPLQKPALPVPLFIWKNFAAAEKLYKTICCCISESKFDSSLFHTTTKHRLTFQNGVLDFKTKTFYTWEEVTFPYYTTVMIPYPYERTTEYQFLIDKIIEPIFNENVELALKYLSRSIAGCIEDKNFATYMGNRNCGKGVLFSLLQAFGSYISAFNIQCILNQKSSNEVTARDFYWLLPLEFVRLAVSQEIPKDATLKPELIKKLCSGGDDIVARRNYDRCDTTFNIDCSFFLLGNEEVVCPTDVAEHALRFEGSTQFISDAQYKAYKESGASECAMKRYRIGDSNIKEKCVSREWHIAFVNLLLDKFVDEPTKINVCDIEDATISLSPIDSLLKSYDITKKQCDVVLGEDIHDIYGKKIKAELKNLGVKYERCKNLVYRDRWVYRGIRHKEPEDASSNAD